MNLLLDQRFAESITLLALGIEPVDAGRRGRVPGTVELLLESPLPAGGPIGAGGEVTEGFRRMERHGSCRYVLRYGPTLRSPIDLRLLDRSRQYVPRRLRIPIPSEAAVVANQPPVPLTDRVRRPVLFPGAAYPVTETATGVRGRVERGGAPMRWARIEATLPGGEPVGRAHGDDRGDFLLLLSLAPTHVGAVTDPLRILVSVFGPDPAPAPDPAWLPSADPYWDLPLEEPALPGAPDPVSAGSVLPAGYRPSAAGPVQVDLPLGRLSSSSVPVFAFT